MRAINAMIQMENCTCQDSSQTKDAVCVKCLDTFKDIKLDITERMFKCKQHHFMPICGLYDFLCVKCTESGWKSTAGTGCQPYLFNSITNEVLRERELK
jgi:hypothetical protein